MYPNSVTPLADDVQNFYQRLVDHNLIPQSRASHELNSLQSTPHRDYDPRCPMCSSRLIACDGCSIISCNKNHCRCESGKDQCAGAVLVPVVCCRCHNDRVYCTACFADSKHSSSRIQCLHCRYWSCTNCIMACIGRHDPSLKLARTHPPKILACRTCVDDSCTVCPWDTCDESACWSYSPSYYGVICPDCIGSMGSDLACPCGEILVCGACAPKSILESGGRCPGCQTFYCFACGYIDTCTDCLKMTLCNDCMEEDGELTAKKGVFLTVTCEECHERICADCFDGRESCCQSCNSIHCQDCVDHVQCSDCGVFMCLACLAAGCQNCEDEATKKP